MLALLAGGLLPAAAEPAPDADIAIPESNSDKLERIEQERAQVAAREAALATAARELGADIVALKRKAAETAAAIQAAEAALSDAEAEKARLERRAFEVRADLDSQQARLERIVAVLLRMGRNPPPALLVRPEDATEAARSAMLLSAVVPFLEAEAGKLAAALAELTRLGTLIAAQQEELARQGETLAALRVEIDLTLAERDRDAKSNAAALADERRRLRTLANDAKDVAGLIAKLSGEQPKLALDPDDPTAPVMVLSEAAAKAPLRFAAMKGALIWPAAGEIGARFAAEPELGGRAKGLVLVTRPGAQVVAPADGRISFADVYRGYGNLLIISTGDGYHILLAGMARIDAMAEQWVIAGEPVGVMGSGPAGPALEDPEIDGAGTPAGGTGPGGPDDGGTPDAGPGGAGPAGGPGIELYVELQKNGVAINPEPWFASRRKVSG